ncbi:MAG: alpha/beta hydrolase [Chloroflexi bacterium]|nr:alpha/beta hydrolase [Chloroflexota bacterium]
MQPPQDTDLVLRITGAEAAPQPDGTYAVMLRTTRGAIHGMLHIAEGATGAVVWGSRGGTAEEGAPRDAFYDEVARELLAQRISSFRLWFRVPAPAPPGFTECVLDLLGGVSFLRGIGAQGIALVGASFAGGAVINAGAISPHVTAVIALASQLHGARHHAEHIAPRPLVLIHGTDDTVLEYESSRIIYAWAGEPKELLLIEGMGHDIGGGATREQVKALLLDRLTRFVGPTALSGGNT